MLGVARRFVLVAAGGALLFALTSTARAAFPGRNGRIVFTTDVPGVGEHLFDIRPDGGELRNLSNTPAQDFMASYSPDGRLIVFGRTPDECCEHVELWVMDANGTHQRRLTFNQQPDYSAAWSPDGRQLVFVRRPATSTTPGEPFGPTDLWTLDLRTGAEHQLTNNPETEDDRPQWSPDGERIVFQSEVKEPGNVDIYTIRPNGRDLRRITTTPSFDAFPNYSPDGKQITFTSDRAPDFGEFDDFDVFVMRSDGSRPTRLTNDPADDFLSSFSPDGRFISFSSERDGAVPDDPTTFPSDIFRMRADGSLTRSPAVFDFDSDWQPL
jgi:Tol biopolymer transport system component